MITSAFEADAFAISRVSADRIKSLLVGPERGRRDREIDDAARTALGDKRHRRPSAEPNEGQADTLQAGQVEAGRHGEQPRRGRGRCQQRQNPSRLSCSAAIFAVEATFEAARKMSSAR